jgi:bifunctional DNase/RNase
MDLIPFVVTQKSVIMFDDDPERVVVLIKASGINVPLNISAYDGACIAAATKDADFDEESPGELAYGILAALGGTLVRIAITELTDDEFRAVMFIRKPGETEEISVRISPQYAIALAIKCRVPMFIDDGIAMDISSGREAQELLEKLQEHYPEVLQC